MEETSENPVNVRDEDSGEEVTLTSHAVRYGVILALAGIIFTVLIYIVSPPLLGNPWMGLLLIAYFVYLIFVGINYRKQIGGYIDFGKAFQHAFIVLVVSGVIGLLFNLLLYTVIDTSLPETIADATVETTRSMMERFGAPESQMDEALEKARVDAIERFTVVGQLKGFGWGFIFYAIAASITGLIVRKREPEEM